MINIVDLTHLLHNNIAVYPGTERPCISHIYNIQEHGFAETRLNLLSHHGTHMDAPAHMIKDGNTLDMFQPEQFYGKAICIDCKRIENEQIELHLIEWFKDKIELVDFVLFNTGWSEKWGTEEYYSHFPVLSPEACKWLSNYNLKGIGLDNISLDRIDTSDFANHKIILGKGMVIIENLNNLKFVGKDIFTLSCFPLKFENSDGAPIRAIAIL
jgi:kynurenine formamidase